MAHFIGDVQGNRGSVSRTGSKKSGITADIRGWETGVRLWITHNEDTGKDEITVFKTSGSNGNKRDEIVFEDKGV